MRAYIEINSLHVKKNIKIVSIHCSGQMTKYTVFIFKYKNEKCHYLKNIHIYDILTFQT